jgi:hypothetical protein
LLLLVKRKIPSFTSPHLWEYSDLPSKTGWSIDWHTILPGEFSWKTDSWDWTVAQQKSRNLSLLGIVIWNVLQIHFWHSSNMVWHMRSFRVCPNSKSETIRDVQHVKFLLQLCETGGDFKTHKFVFVIW